MGIQVLLFYLSHGSPISSGYACCSHVYCRNGTKSDTRNTYFFERVFHSLRDACKSYSIMLKISDLKYSNSRFPIF